MKKRKGPADKNGRRNNEPEPIQQTEEVEHVLVKELNPLAATVKAAVKRAVNHVGEDVVRDAELKSTVKKVVKRVVKAAAKEAMK